MKVTATISLIRELLKHGEVEKGNICYNQDGLPYRHDRVTLKYKHAAYRLVQLFNKAAEENNAKHKKQFFAGDYSFYFERALFKGQPNGKIGYSQLIKL